MRLLVPILTYLKKKVFSSNFCKINKWSILLNSMVLSRSGEGAGDAIFLLKCHALHPICLKTSVVLKVCSSIYRLYPLCVLHRFVFIWQELFLAGCLASAIFVCTANLYAVRYRKGANIIGQPS